MKLIKETIDAYSPENLARLYKDDLAKYCAIMRDASAQYQDYKRNVAGYVDSATDRAYRQEYALMKEKAHKILNSLPLPKDVDRSAVVNAYRKLSRKGGLNEPTVPLPVKRKLDFKNRSQRFEKSDWNVKQGENFILYPDNERYEVTYAVEGDRNVICTNLDTDDTITFDKGELTQMYHNNEIKFI